MNSSTSLTLIVFSLYVLLMFIPMIPMLKSIYKKEDYAPLYMDLDYIFNPRFQVENFEKSLTENDKNFTEVKIEKKVESSFVPNKISKPLLFSSTVNVSLSGKILEEAILYSKGDIVTQKGSAIFALKSNASIVVGEKTRIDSWIDADESVTIEKGAEINLVTAKSVRFYPGARFKRIYADTIGIYPLNKKDENKSGIDFIHDKTHQHIEEEVLYFEGNKVLPKGSSINSDIVCRGDLVIEEGCKILGSIKTNGTLNVKHNNYIYGNIFSDEKIMIEDNCFVFGNIFSDTFIYIGKNGQIGRYDLPKSIIGIKGVEIASGTFIHNYILTYGEGKIV